MTYKVVMGVLYLRKKKRKKSYYRRRKAIFSLLFIIIFLGSAALLIRLMNPDKTVKTQADLKNVYSSNTDNGHAIPLPESAKAGSTINDKLHINKGSKDSNTNLNSGNVQATTPNDNQNNNQKPSSEGAINSKDLLDVNSLLKNDGIKTVYLTFDDGPSKTVTPRVLDILKKNNVTATFFIIGKMAEESPELVKKEYNEGYSIGYHSYSHDYNKMYGNLNDFTNDFNHDDQVMKSILGTNFSTRIYRFPGGAFKNLKYVPYENFLKEKGYTYIDWNALNGDAESPGRKTPEQLFNRFKSTVESGYKEDLIVLMHDTYTKESTAEILPSIIQYLRNKGYEFRQIK